MLGLGLVAAAMLLTAKNLSEEKTAEKAAAKAVEEIERAVPERKSVPQKEAGTETEAVMPVREAAGGEYAALLSIPALDLKLLVQNDWSYEKLKTSPCLYSGSMYTDDLVILAHNYDGHFGRLKDLRPGDTVKITDMDGRESGYTVVKTETIEPDAADEMASGEYALTLFTCTPGGGKRTAVRCSKKSE